MTFDGFLQNPTLLAENLMKTLKHGSLHKKLLVFAKWMSFDGFSQIPTLFAENLMKIVKHGSLH